MKRLITIFLSSFIVISLSGQTQDLPMTVVGDVYVDNTGIMKSLGPVHLMAVSADTMARLANYGKLDMDTIIFYSNDVSDGLLMNQADLAATAKGVVTPEVAVRKTFKKSNAWYQISFPYDVYIGRTSGGADPLIGVVNPLTGKQLVRGDDFQVQYYDGQKRAEVGKNVDTIWVTLPASETVMKKGVGYRVAVKLTKLAADTAGAAMGRFSVDFYAKSSPKITELFNRDIKGVDLAYPYTGHWAYDDNSYGWNAIGGLNSTEYLVNSSTIEYPDPVYYWGDATGKWEELYPSAETGTLRPYAVIFVKTKTNNADFLTFLKTRVASNHGGFTYVGNGSGLTVEPEGDIFRSSSSASTEDLLELQLADAKNAFTSKIYFQFDDAYTSAFKSAEGDAIRLETKSTVAPIVWAVSYNEHDVKYITFVDRLPYGEHEVPLGVNIPAAGEYNFSMREVFNEKIKSAVLWDKVTNIKTELFTSGYSFKSTGSINLESRFVILLNKSITSIDQIGGTSEIYAFAENNVLTVKNLNTGDKVQVLDMAGRLVASGEASGDTYSVTLNQKGVYVVNARGEKILKVLNK